MKVHEIVTCGTHPMDSEKRLLLITDFPHLIKTMRMRILKNKALKIVLNNN